MKSKVSIIIPSYNSSKYIDKCIDSLLNQTYKNIEIIVVDNNSSDNTVKLLEKKYSACSKLKIYVEKKKGPSYCRNFGLEKATGDYILFVDSDDWIEYNSIEELLDNYDKNYFNGLERVMIFESNKKHNYNFSKKIDGNIVDLIMFGNVGGFTTGFIFDKKLIKNIRFDTETQYMEDTLFVLEYCKHNSIRGINLIESQYYYFQNMQSITNNIDKIKKNIILMNYVLNIVEDKYKLSSEKIAVKKFKILDSSLAKLNKTKDLIDLIDTEIVDILKSIKETIDSKYETYYLNQLIKKRALFIFVYFKFRKLIKKMKGMIK